MRPAPLLLALLLAWAALGGLVLGGWLPRWSWAPAVAIALPALWDLWRQWRPSPQVQRERPEALALGVRREAALRVQAEQSMTVQVFDLVPGGWPLEALPQRVSLQAGTSTLHYHLQPLQRGHSASRVHLRMRSPWRLVAATQRAAGAGGAGLSELRAARFSLFSADQARGWSVRT